jgi:stage II sporulation protein AA (anti-sigma F factor antagonist)
MSTVEIRTKMLEGAAVIYPGPYLNQLRGESIEKRCHELLAGGVRRLVINFEETELVNSIGISILLGVIEAVNEAKGALVLSNLSASNRELFEMLGLMSHISIEQTEERALRALGGQVMLITKPGAGLLCLLF